MNQLSIPEFLEAIASDSPVPGGGSVSALCGGLGSALGAMVCRLTMGRKKYAEHEAEVVEIADKLLPAIDYLNRAITLDSEAYNKVMNAFRLPKETEAEKAARNAAIGAASIEAATVPMSVAETALKSMHHIAPLVHIGNQNAITDMGVAVMCCRTAVLGACLNVRINLGSTGNEAAEEDLRSRAAACEKEAIELSDALYGQVSKIVG